MEKGKSVLHLKGVDDDIKRRFKALCTIRKVKLPEAITRLMKMEVDRSQKEYVR